MSRSKSFETLRSMYVPRIITLKTKEQLASFLQKCGGHLGPGIGLELCDNPLVHFLRDCPKERAGQTIIYPTTMVLGLRFSIDPFIQEVCRKLGKPLGAINPNSLKVVLGFVALNKVKGCNLSY